MPTAAPPLRAWWLWLVAGLAVLAHVGALGAYFAQDDFLYLHRALTSDPTPFWAARYLSLDLWFRALARLFGLWAPAYHAASLLLIAGIGVLVTLVMARYVRAWVAAAAGALVVTSPVLFVPARWAAANSDLLSALLAGAAFVAVAPGARPGLRRLAPLPFALALWSKEIAVGAAPLLAWLELRSPRPSRIRALFYVAAAAATALLAPWHMASYSTRWGAALPNLPRYVAAVAAGSAASLSPSEETWGRLPWVAALGGLVLAGWLVLLLRRRSAAAWLASAWFLCLLAPVLPLQRQFYFYYATCALPGLWCSALLLAAPRAGGQPPRWLWPAVVAVCVVQLAGVQAREHARLEGSVQLADFALRREAVAREVIASVVAHRDELQPSVAVVGWQPGGPGTSGARTPAGATYTVDPYWDWSLRIALYDGLAVKLVAPQVRDVAFVRWVGPGDSARTIIEVGADSRVRVSSYEEYASVPPFDPGDPPGSRIARANRFIELHLFPSAARELVAAVRLVPNDPTVFLNLGTLYAAMGDTVSARAALARALAIAPADMDARFNLGVLDWQSGARNEARRVWRPILETAPASDRARQIRAVLEGS